MIQILEWFLWRRNRFEHRVYARYCMMLDLNKFLSECYNNNLYGCRKHPVIYNDMCRIVRGGK
jgi:hypothetical protein